MLYKNQTSDEDFSCSLFSFSAKFKDKNAFKSCSLPSSSALEWWGLLWFLYFWVCSCSEVLPFLFLFVFLFYDHSVILLIFSVSTWIVQMTGEINYCWHSIISKNSFLSTRSTNHRFLKAFGSNVCLADQVFYLLSHISYISSPTSGFCPDLSGT